MKQMMKWAVLALLLVCCVSTLWGCGAEKKEPTPPVGTTDVPDLDHPENDGTTQTVVVEESVVFNSGDLTLRFVKNAQGKWVWKEDVSFPLQQSYVTDILSAAQEILAATPLDAAAAADHGAAGNGRRRQLLACDLSDLFGGFLAADTAEIDVCGAVGNGLGIFVTGAPAAGTAVGTGKLGADLIKGQICDDTEAAAGDGEQSAEKQT